MGAKCSLRLIEMSNGDAYFINDNGRIRQKTRKVQSTGHSITYSVCDTYHPSSDSHGDARPKNTHYYDNYRNPAFDYGTSYYNSHRSINQITLDEIRTFPENQRDLDQPQNLVTMVTKITAHNSKMVI